MRTASQLLLQSRGNLINNLKLDIEGSSIKNLQSKEKYAMQEGWKTVLNRNEGENVKVQIPETLPPVTTVALKLRLIKLAGNSGVEREKKRRHLDKLQPVKQVPNYLDSSKHYKSLTIMDNIKKAQHNRSIEASPQRSVIEEEREGKDVEFDKIEEYIPKKSAKQTQIKTFKQISPDKPSGPLTDQDNGKAEKIIEQLQDNLKSKQFSKSYQFLYSNSCITYDQSISRSDYNENV